MIDAKRMAEAAADGVIFLCRTCPAYFEGEDRGQRDADGHVVCTGAGCRSPISGGSFDKYRGPINDLTKVCCFCGAENPEHALEAGVSMARKVGCCARCLDHVRRLAPSQLSDGRKLVWVKEEAAEPERYEVLNP